MKLFQSSLWVEIDVRHMKEAPQHYLGIYLKRVNKQAKVCCPSLSWNSLL
jgi:hypothetical protein